MTDNEKRVLRLIPRGRERPIPLKELASFTKLTERTIQDIIARLILRHRVPIIGDRSIHGGYYIPSTEEERVAGLTALKSQTNEQLDRLNVATYCSLTEWERLLEN